MEEARTYRIHQQLDKALKKADDVLGELDYIQANIKSEIEYLTELHGEVCERADYLAKSIDLNRKIESEE